MAITAPALADVCQLRLATADERRTFDEKGVVILRSLVHPEAVVTMCEEVLAVVRARNLADSFLGQSQEYLRGGILDAWINGGNLRRLAEDLLGASSRVYLPFTAVKGPRQGRFTFHQDNQYTPHRGVGPHLGLNVWCALTPMRPENGCLQVVPGSHRDGILPMIESSECPGHRRLAQEPTAWIDCIMEPGDVAVFDRNNVHGSGANATGEPRVAYAVQWHRDDTEAFFNGSWALLRDRPLYDTGPVERLGTAAGRGE